MNTSTSEATSPELIDVQQETSTAVDSNSSSSQHLANLSRWQRFKKRFPHGINWTVTLWMAIMHVGAIVALWNFSWAGLVCFLVLHFATACLGVTLGYHRLLTHGSLIVPNPLKYFFSFCGMLSGEGSPIFWVATHRKHHAFSDQEGDPHSPNDGFWWSHMFWLHPKRTDQEVRQVINRWAPDLWKDPVQRFFHHFYPLTFIATGVVLYLMGEFMLGGIGWSMVLWGLCLRIVAVYHGTWFVNSATHMWGYRNYFTKDRSRNLWWVAILAYGEGWHNNHHAYQRLARHGHRWWEIDVTYAVIWSLKKLGLAKAVQDELPARR